MRLLSKIPVVLVILAALSVGACKNLVIRPPDDAAGYYAHPGGPGER